MFGKVREQNWRQHVVNMPLFQYRPSKNQVMQNCNCRNNMLQHFVRKALTPRLAVSQMHLSNCTKGLAQVLRQADLLHRTTFCAPLGSVAVQHYSTRGKHFLSKPSNAEKKRLESIRKQGESKRRAYSLEKGEQKRDVQYIYITTDTSDDSESTQTERLIDTAAAVHAVSDQDPSVCGDEKKQPQEEEVIDNNGVYIIDNVTQAQRIVALLSSKYKDMCHACDSEVADIDVKSASPVEHGNMISFSLFCGPEAHFGVGIANGTRQNKIWVDLLDCEDKEGILEAFKPFFENENIKKIWHNYGFDRHIFSNHGIQCKGFYGDTMHMARLWDSSRTKKGGYSLESLSGDSILMGEKHKLYKKTSMKELFGRPNIKKDNTEGKLIIVPPVDELQQDKKTRSKWIKYCALDAEATWHLHQALQRQLVEVECVGDGVNMLNMFGDLSSQRGTFTAFDFYKHFWRPFGNLLTDMEALGMLVELEHLKEVEIIARKDQQEAKDFFRTWASEKVPDSKLMSVGSALQIRQLLFAGAPNLKDMSQFVELVRTFKVPNEIGFIEEGKKKPKKNIEIELYSLWGKDVPSPLQVEHHTPSGWPAANTPVLRSIAGKPGKAKSILLNGSPAVEITDDDDEAVELTEDEVVLEDDSQYTLGHNGILQEDELNREAQEMDLGKGYAAFGGGREGLHACAAIDSLCDVAAIDTLLSNFIVPLQGDAIKCRNGRIHCSMNINTETGRLSARRPNLQNQPALEKDRYKIRQAFTADVKAGKTLVVADYGQLELRLLAHMTSCKSMLDAFEHGGDFHSRTALGMYEHIQDAVDRGECLLEWDGGADGEEPPVPLIKDMFSVERRKAKVLNFSIAYGKTAHGLAKDWKVTLKEAEETLNRWYRDRPEVKEWQEARIVEAHQNKSVRTLLGRQRHLHQINSSKPGIRKHYERAAINTPIQGGAADVAMLAMLEIERCKELEDLEWKLLLQVHDEVILEGPAESKERALQLVRHCMENPFRGTNPLQVSLSVDAKTDDTWYGAK